MALKNYYDLLGIQSSSSQEEIKKAYRKLSLKFHPDKNDGDEFLVGMFKSINEANEILSNPERRKDYDRKLKDAQDVRKNYDFAEKAEPNQPAPSDFIPGTTAEDIQRLQGLWKQYSAQKKVADSAYDKLVYARTVDSPQYLTTKNVLRSVLALLLVWLFLRPSDDLAKTANEGTTYEWVTTESTKVYKKADIQSKVLGELHQGTKLHSLTETNYFIKVNFTDDKGIENMAFVRKSSLSRN